MADAQLKRWSEAWKSAGAELEARRRADLRALTDDEVRRAVADLFSLPQRADLPPRLACGLVEQQRFFARLRAGK